MKTLEAEEIQENVSLSTEHERLINVLSYLAQITPIETPATEIEQYQEFNLKQSALNDLPGFKFNYTDDLGGPIWMEIQRLKPVSVPTVDELLTDWVKSEDDPEQQPTLLTSIIQEVRWCDSKQFDPQLTREPNELVQQEILLSDYPEISAAFEKYLSDTWRPWAQVEKPKRESIRLYGKFYKLMRKVENEDATSPIEILWGGVLTTGVANGKKINFPLITSPVFLSIHEQTKSILVQPRVLAALKPQLEHRTYQNLAIDGLKNLITCYKEWSESADFAYSPFEPPTYEAVARSAAAHLSPNGSYLRDEDLNSITISQLIQSKGGLLLSDEWCLFARPRNRHYLIEDIKNIQNNLKNGAPLNYGPKQLVADPSDEKRVDIKRNYRGTWGTIKSTFGHESVDNDKEEPTELFFPKPYNTEQLNIIDRLNHCEGVVVQGPPGTGKTHTIANIICHYLALGKKVLVTSQGSTALSVLRDKLPEDIRPLAVTRLGNDNESSKQTEESIRWISESIDAESEDNLRLRIQQGSQKIDELHLNITSLGKEMADWATKQITTVPYDQENRLPIDIAQLVVKEKAIFDWFPDKLGISEKYEARFCSEDISELRLACGLLKQEISFLSEINPTKQQLPNTDDITELVKEKLELLELARQSKETKASDFKNHDEKTIANAEALVAIIRQYQAELRFFKTAQPWAQLILKEIRDRTDAPTAQVLLALYKACAELNRKREDRLAKRANIPSNAEHNELLLKIVQQKAEGKSGPNFLTVALSGKYRECNTILKQITIDGKSINSKADWLYIYEELNLINEIRKQITIWNNLSSELEAPTVEKIRFEGLKELWQRLAVVQSALKINNQQCQNIIELHAQVFRTPLSPNAQLADEPLLDQILNSLKLGLPKQRAAAFNRKIEQIKSSINNYTGRLQKKILEVISSIEDGKASSHNTVETAWLSILKEAEYQLELTTAKATAKRVLALLEDSGASNLVKKITALGASDRVNLLPDNLLHIWQLRRWQTYLEEIDCQNIFKSLTEQKIAAERQLAKTYEEVIKYRTWLQLKARLTGRIRSSLNAYSNAARQIGRGKGVRAPRFRREMQQAMSDAWSAIPCWIMPQWLVSQTMPSQIGLFDLVILDEASQSSADAIPVILRGKKILVVGDDEQISPTAFVLEKDIERKSAEYLNKLHPNYRAQLAPGKSFYDFAKVVFPNSQVVLREHFRCTEPIIAFSNNLSYEGRIQCLRIPSPSERIEPPLVHVFVKNSKREHKRNLREAEAIVREIKRISATDRLKHRSIGVISLIGAEQAQLIYSLIEQKIGRDIIERHQIACGDSSTFQGNERDIIFLSMIVTPETVRAATDRSFKQRLNVAASRARDRMYLYSSVQIKDLKPNDLKYQLLDFFSDPLPKISDDITEVRQLCESEFERQMFDELIQRGYSVKPQVKSSGFSIDLVVEGASDARLAIECDGDRYHTPDKWDQDIQRQRVLERAGWQFWRCWGSAFYANREACLQSLVETLQRHQIDPQTDRNLSINVSPYVEYREEDPTVENYWDDFDSALTEPPVTPTADVPLAIDSENEAQKQPEINQDSQKTRKKGRVDLDELVEYDIIEQSIVVPDFNAPVTPRTLRVVELGNTDLIKGIVSAKTALGRVLLGSTVGDVFEFESNGAKVLAEIRKIHDIIEEDSHEDSGDHSDAANATLAARRGVTLHPYNCWKERPLPDPRSSRPSQILDGLVDIVRSEGPIVCKRAFKTYLKNAGLIRLGGEVKEALIRGLQAAIAKGLLKSTNEMNRKDRLSNILTIPGQVTSLPRQGAGRTLDEIPISEIAMVLKQVIANKGGGDRNSIFKETIQLFGCDRLTAAAREILSLAELRLDDKE